MLVNTQSGKLNVQFVRMPDGTLDAILQLKQPWWLRLWLRAKLLLAP